MVTRSVVDRFLTELFMIDKCADRALNGLQVEGASEITGFCLGVDACMDLFQAAVDTGSNYIVVHHGFFWGQQIPLTGLWAERFTFLLANRLSLFAAHLPMDAHPEFGHNILIAKALGLQELQPFGAYKGMTLGYMGALTAEEPLAKVLTRLAVMFAGPPRVLGFGSPMLRRIGVVSGAASEYEILQEAKDNEVDLLLTGETNHVAFHMARELKINIAFCGHYETEKWALLHLGEIMTRRFGLPAKFIYLPTNL